MITIIDYGMGNIGSLENMIKRAGGEVLVSSDPLTISKADKLILPGVGHYDQAIDRLRELNLFDTIDRTVKEKNVPILCICLGAQLATESSEEGNSKGFGWVKGRTVKFKLDPIYKIPHMGWNDIKVNKQSYILKDLPEDPCFYFVHSYHMIISSSEDVLTTTVYGDEFASSFEYKNVVGMQFHPEKSHKYGLCIMKNFVER